MVYCVSSSIVNELITLPFFAVAADGEPSRRCALQQQMPALPACQPQSFPRCLSTENKDWDFLMPSSHLFALRFYLSNRYGNS